MAGNDISTIASKGYGERIFEGFYYLLEGSIE
jgi:hypothetical protein